MTLLIKRDFLLSRSFIIYNQKTNDSFIILNINNNKKYILYFNWYFKERSIQGAFETNRFNKYIY